MKKILANIGIIFVIMGFLQIITLSILCGIDHVEYSGQNHFIGFMSQQGLWGFFYGALIIIICGLVMSLSAFLKKK